MTLPTTLTIDECCLRFTDESHGHFTDEFLIVEHSSERTIYRWISAFTSGCCHCVIHNFLVVLEFIQVNFPSPISLAQFVQGARSNCLVTILLNDLCVTKIIK